VDRSRDGRLLGVELVGEFETRDVLAVMARARHLAEGCDAEFGVLVDVREFDASASALAALGEWETLLRVAGATAVVRVDDDHAVGGADHRVASVEEAERLLAQR
jgi:hypothetical protein